MRKWSTIIVVSSLVFTFAFGGQDYVKAITTPICLVGFDMLLSKMIEIV